ncbi:hypothetical protein BX666DRAFT_1992008 [Dichotomocladium elegans]|nr:hypothetical protein BX666DRAFT_1992008 [Dichotomocladium elegans]
MIHHVSSILSFLFLPSVAHIPAHGTIMHEPLSRHISGKNTGPQHQHDDAAPTAWRGCTISTSSLAIDTYYSP